MKRHAEEPAALEKRAQPGRLRAVFLALVVHALFFGLIIFGVTWQSSPSPPVEVELWDKLPPAPTKASPPKPEPPKPEPPKPDVKPDPPKPDPQIALRAEREKREKEKRERLEKQKQDEVAKKREREEVQKKRDQEEVAKKKREDEKRRRDQEIAKREAEKAREAVASERQKEFDRFVNAIRAKIRGRANVPDTVTGRPSVQVQIRILPGGDVLDIRILKSSGNRVYDTAIERAIRSAQPLPVPPANSELFPQFRELILNIEHER